MQTRRRCKSCSQSGPYSYVGRQSLQHRQLGARCPCVALRAHTYASASLYSALGEQSNTSVGLTIAWKRVFHCSLQFIGTFNKKHAIHSRSNGQKKTPHPREMNAERRTVLSQQVVCVMLPWLLLPVCGGLPAAPVPPPPPRGGACGRPHALGFPSAVKGRWRGDDEVCAARRTPIERVRGGMDDNEPVRVLCCVVGGRGADTQARCCLGINPATWCAGRH